MEDKELHEFEASENTELPSFIPEKEYYTVVDIRFRDGGKNYFFDPGELTLKTGDKVIADTSRGPEFGICTAGNHEIKGTEIVASLRGVLRLATEQDCRTAETNREKEQWAFGVCLDKIKELGLEMQLISAEYAFDGSKILFFFTADGRVDFRELVKVLASIFRTRIELRQIGVRDKAKMVGGLGICGRPFCCREFLPDFQPVSIKMAKTQNLSLNPTKISGTCGRLMCCLKYEQDVYEELIKDAPKAESLVDTPDGRGTITEVQLLKESVKVRMDKDPDCYNCYRNEDICVLRSGKPKKGDLPIPDDYNPISSAPRPAVKAPDPEFDPVVFHSETVFVEAPVNTENDTPAPKDKKRRSRRDRKRSSGQKEATELSAEEAPREAVSPDAPQRTEKQGHKHKNRSHEKKPADAVPAAAPAETVAREISGEESSDAPEKKKKHRRYYRGKKSNKPQT